MTPNPPLPTDPIIFGNSRANHPVGIFTYPAGEPGVTWGSIKHVHESLNLRRKDSVKLLVRTTKMDEFCAAMFMVDALTERGNPVPHLILPQVPGARQDRLNDEGDFLFTIKSIAGMINARNFPTVTTLDPHSDVTPALINRCRVVHAADIYAAGLNVNQPRHDYVGVIAPDAGAAKRAAGVAKMLGVPAYQAWKVRDIRDGSLAGFGCQSLPDTDGKFLLVDDLCDGGGTFVGLADHLIDTRLDLYVTHGLFTKGFDALATRFEEIITTDSTPPADYEVYSRFTVLNTCQGLIERNIIT
jgi:ribose-phosphate pyrophosphokinase